MSTYTVIIEQTRTGFSAYIPDLPGCVATGRTREETTARLERAVEMHLAAMRADNEPVPSPTTGAFELSTPALSTAQGPVDLPGQVSRRLPEVKMQK